MCGLKAVTARKLKITNHLLPENETWGGEGGVGVIHCYPDATIYPEWI